MPSARDHLIQAQHNRRLLAALWAGSPTRSDWLARIMAVVRPGRSSYPDWVVTVAFYVAVHLVEAYFGRKHKPHSRSHGARYRTFTSMHELRPINREYSELSNLSKNSRYDCVPGKWTPVEVQRVLGLLNSIEQHFDSLP